MLKYDIAKAIALTDIFSPEKRSYVMKQVKTKNTSLELKIRSALHKHGLRFKIHDKSLPGSPDIVLLKYKTVIDVRGCFWHGHKCKKGHIPSTHLDYWKPKLKDNKERDARNDKQLKSLGWKVIVVWGCKCDKNEDFHREIDKILKILKKEQSHKFYKPFSSWFKF